MTERGPAPGGAEPPRGEPPRSDMVQSAVAFLEDPKVQSSSLSQRVQFLEAKGMSPQEIDMALAHAADAASAGAVQGPRAGAPYPMLMPAYPRVAPPRRDWRDWFIMAVVSGTVGYGVVALARRYLLPHLQPPNQTVLEAERDELTAKYDEVAVHLEELDQTTEAIRAGLAEHGAEIEKSVHDVNDMVRDVRVREDRRDQDMDEMKTQIDEMRSEFNDLLTRSKRSQVNALVDLQGELKSLRSLLVSRGGVTGAGSTGASTPSAAPAPSVADADAEKTEDATTPPLRPAPTIPAWQLADPAEE
ncbi:peroxisomal membrane protein pex14 [Malassezia sp. CBS 17886]|nr:peroxisomal membrane protein pex14 [Malassezia sp. CBS 17886]